MVVGPGTGVYSCGGEPVVCYAGSKGGTPAGCLVRIITGDGISQVHVHTKIDEPKEG